MKPAQSNVLIDAKGCPRLSGFSLWPIRRVTDPIDASVPDFDSRARYSAPELLDAAGLVRAKKERPTRKSDVYSLSMVIVEVRSFPYRVVSSDYHGFLF